MTAIGYKPTVAIAQFYPDGRRLVANNPAGSPIAKVDLNGIARPVQIYQSFPFVPYSIHTPIVNEPALFVNDC